MIDMRYVMFHDAFLCSLEEAQDAYEKANELDFQNGGEYFSHEQLYKIAFNYVVFDDSVKVDNLEKMPMKEFIESLLELAHKRTLPTPESMVNESQKDFAKKTFLIIMANSIMEKI